MTMFFPVDIWPKREARGPYVNGKKRGSRTEKTMLFVKANPDEVLMLETSAFRIPARTVVSLHYSRTSTNGHLSATATSSRRTSLQWPPQ